MAAKLKAKTTGESAMVGIRFRAEVLERVAAHIERMKKANAFALEITQSDAVRDLVLRGLAAVEAAK
jgi:hypothetical protein